MNYNLQHLTQKANQKVLGPIQDDEALFLYSFIKTTLTRNVVELGFQDGYSAQNFLAAVGLKGKVVSIDINTVTKLASNHFPITKDVADVLPEELPFDTIDLAFYDTHDYESTIAFHQAMLDSNKITKQTTIVLHDTGTHHKYVYQGYRVKGGVAHEPRERDVCNFLINEGWHAIHAHGINKNFDSDEELAFRHGLTFLQKETVLDTTPVN